MSAAMELALAAWVLRLSAILDAVAFLSTVEALVAPWWGRLALAFLLLIVKDASLTQTYSFLPASWAGDTHEETDFLPIGDREVKG